MQIKCLHKNIYKLYRYARTQECLDAYRIKHEDKVRHWNALKAEGVCDEKCAEFTGISRATYYRYKRVLEQLKEGRTPPSKRPRRVNKPRWGEAEKQLVLAVACGDVEVANASGQTRCDCAGPGRYETP